MRAAAAALTLALLPGCSYDIVVIKNVGEGCSSTAAGQADTDTEGDATGTAAGGGGAFGARMMRAMATDDRCPGEDLEERPPDFEVPPPE